MNTVIIYTLEMSLLLMTILFLTYLGKYINLKKKTKNIISNLSSPLRKGYYVLCLKTRDESEKFESTVYVKELDRYTNGESKVEIEKIELGIENDRVSTLVIEEHIRGEFKSIMKTSSITWLESEVSIKQKRREKLEQLKSILKK